MTTPWAHHKAAVNGITLHYVEAGTGPLVLLLHGFPEFWYSWRHQVPALAAAGFRVLAPDLRGYNESDKPAGVRHYRVEALVEDVAGLIRHSGQERAFVVGHDWGGAIAWHLALTHPELAARLVILNSPHPVLFVRRLWRPYQLFKSWYMFFFQLPWLPEWLLRRNHFALMKRTFRSDPVRRGAFTPGDILCYETALAQPGALTASINYYRAAFRRNPFQFSRSFRPLSLPTLVIWGERDRYLDSRLLPGTEAWAGNLRIERLPNASHWVQNDAPEQVNQLLIEFLTRD